MRFVTLARFAAMLVGTIVVSGCATLSNGREWGEDATIAPGWMRVRDVAVGALESPRFWAPLAAAAVFQIDGWDRKVSNWARANTPVFGSEHSAYDWSDRLRSLSQYAYLASALATPSGSDPERWLLDKVKGVAVGYAAAAATDEESVLLQDSADRKRPNGAPTGSMPSLHTSSSAVFTELAERNVDSLDLSKTLRRILDFGLDGLTYATAWARIEAGYHFPSDTLVGMSIGNFNGAFFNDAFLGPRNAPPNLTFSFEPLPGGAALQLRYGL